MEHTANIEARAAIEATPPGRLNPWTAPTASTRLLDTLINEALHTGRDRRRDRAQRADGWTALRVRTFLEMLARSGSVAAAARAAGVSRQSAYALRSSAKGQAFDDAWRSALLLATPCIPDEMMDRAINGCVDPIIRKGQVWGERHRFDNRLSLRLLRRLDKLAASQSPAARALCAVADEFDDFVEIICAADEAQVEAFLRSRCAAPLSCATQTRNLSTLPRAEAAQPVAPAVASAPPSEAQAPLRKSSYVSTLPADRLDTNRRASPGLNLDGLEKAA